MALVLMGHRPVDLAPVMVATAEVTGAPTVEAAAQIAVASEVGCEPLVPITELNRRMDELSRAIKDDKAWLDAQGGATEVAGSGDDFLGMFGMRALARRVTGSLKMRRLRAFA